MIRIALGWCLLVLAGCAAEAAPTVLYEARDSAGVRIVEYADGPQASRVITVAPTPTWRFGDGPGEYEFQQVTAGALLPDGGAVVSDYGRTEVLAITPDGTLRSVLAREGQGPTEVRNVNGILVLADGRVVVEDDGNRRLMIFEGDSLVRSIGTRDGPGLGIRNSRALGSDGGALLMGTSGYNPRVEEPWITGHFVRFDLASGAVDTAGAYDMAMSFSMTGPLNPLRPFGTAGASGSSFLIGRTDSPELVWRRPDGTAHQILRWEAVRVPQSEAHLQAYADMMRETMPRMNPDMPAAAVEQFVSEQLERMEIDPSASAPLFMAVQGDGAGGVWLAPFQVADPTEGFPTYTVIAPDGEWLGTVTMPDNFRVLDVAGGKVLGVLKDDMDVESVAVFEVTVAEPPAP